MTEPIELNLFTNVTGITKTNRYHRPLLDHVYDGDDNYFIFTTKISPDFAKQSERLSEILCSEDEYFDVMIDGIKFNTAQIALVNQTDTTLTVVVPRLAVHQGWMRRFNEFGIHIEDGPKTPKRITALTRTVGLSMIRNSLRGDEMLRVVTVPPDVFSDYSVGDMVDDLADDPAMTEARARKQFEVTEKMTEMFTDASNVVADWVHSATIDQMVKRVEDLNFNRYEKNMQKLHEDLEEAKASGNEDIIAKLEEEIENTQYDNYNTNVLSRRLHKVIDGSFRLIGPMGEVKGDYLVAPEHSMRSALESRGIIPSKEHDPDPRPIAVITVDANIKHEVRWDSGNYLILEPSSSHAKRGDDMQPDISSRTTDTQTLTWMNGWLYKTKEMYLSTHSWLNRLAKQLEEGEYPRFFQNIGILEDNYSTIDVFQRQVLEFEKNGLGLDHSIFLTRRVMNGLIEKFKSRVSDINAPIPHSLYCHVATDSWLRMCGRPITDWPDESGRTPRGHVWFDEKTGRMIYNDIDFVEDYERHGGWDLDDAIKAHRRRWRGADVWVNLRSPNSYGEWSMRRYMEGTFQPQWITNTENEKIDKFQYPELPDERPEFIEECEIEYRYDSLTEGEMFDYRPAEDASEREHAYTRAFVENKIKHAGNYFGLFGRYVNIQMIEQAYHGTYQRYQLAPLEEVVDVSTQRQNPTALKLIQDDIKRRRKALVEASYKEPIDTFLWKRRAGRGAPANQYDGWFTVLQRDMQQLVSSVTRRVSRLDKKIAENIPVELLELGKRFGPLGQQLLDRYFDLMFVHMRQLQDSDKENDSEEHREMHGKLNDALVSRILDLSRTMQDTHDIVLAIARACYRTARPAGRAGRRYYSDTPLFAHTATIGNYSMSDLYIAALQYYDLPTWIDSPDEWTGFVLCNCNQEDGLELTTCYRPVDMQYVCENF